MTMMEMQGILGEMLSKINDPNSTDRERKKILENAEYTAKIAKQMVNNADIVLRSDKLSNRHDRINVLVGDVQCQSTQTQK